jgi:hypothetical protein
VLSVTEVAVTITLFPVGIAEGAVKIVAVPLAVCAGLNDPHAVLLHETVHFTPPFALSFATFAARLAVAFTTSEVGAAEASVTAIGCTGAVIVIVAEADFVVSVTDVAVTVTVFPVGTAAGAVKVVDAPLGVDGGVNDPHGEPPQVTVQFTPPFALSFATFAVIFVVVPPTRDIGGCADSVTEIGCAGAVIVIVAVTVFVLSVTEVAVTVTVFPVGTAIGAVNTVAPPLAVCDEPNDPHVALPQVTVHLTPAFALSFATFAVRFVVAPATSEAGAAAASVTTIGVVVGGGVGFEFDPPPHPAITSTKAITPVRSEIFRRLLIARLPADRSQHASAGTRRLSSRELEIHSRSAKQSSGRPPRPHEPTSSPARRLTVRSLSPEPSRPPSTDS